MTRKRDIIQVKPVAEPIAAPTPEQAERAVYTEQPILEHRPDGSRSIRGKHWRRLARFETIEGLGVPALLALRRYRAAFDASEVSLTKSALDIRPRGGGGAEAALTRLEQVAFASDSVRRMESAVESRLLATLQAVALQDMTFTEAAIAVFGSRLVDRVDVTANPPTSGNTLAPRSGRHRALVREMFLSAAGQLVNAAREATNSLEIRSAHKGEGKAVSVNVPAIDRRFLDARGRFRPFDEISRILLDQTETSARA